MSNLRPDIAREFGNDPTKTRDADTEAALERNAGHTPADDESAEPRDAEQALKDTVRRQDEAKRS